MPNKNVTRNNRPDLFDKYTGYYSFAGNQPEKFHLLTYKNTKIVHTLFPDKKKHNKKNKCRFAKGIITTTLKFPEAINDLIIPYLNNKEIISYSILFRKYYAEKIERLIIQKHDEIGEVSNQYIIAYRSFNDFEEFQIEDMHALQHDNLNDLEDIINQLDEQGK